MDEFVKQVLVGQFEAALSMLGGCVRLCPEAHWAGLIGRYPFWQVAYHTLCFTDLYLSPDETRFALRPDLHPAGWAEFEDEHPSRRFEKGEIERYTAICRQKTLDTFASETAESLRGPSGHARRTFSRAELHLYNLRHVQHHTGQLSAFLRKVGAEPAWVSTGWR